MRMLSRVSPLLSLAVGLVAQAVPVATPAEPAPPPPSFVDAPFAGLFVDTPRDDGTIWARGATYKASFGAAGVTYVAFFGPQHPALPLRLALNRATVDGVPMALDQTALPGSDGARITFQRGAVVERWDLQPATAEQAFVLAKSPGGGDLVLDLAVATTLAPPERDDGGLVFQAPGLGSVHYSDAVVVDARGRRTALPVSGTANGIQIRVPAAVLATAVFPVVIDPILSSRSFDVSTADSTSPDLCYDATRDVWLLVNQEVVNGADGDIRCRRFAPDGTLLSDTFAESSSDNAVAPSVANSKRHARFLVGWIQHTGIFSQAAMVREHSTTSAGMGSVVTAGTSARGIAAVDIGGSTDSNGLFLVTWTPQFFVSGLFFSDVKCRTYAFGGTLGAVNLLAASVGCGSTVATSRTAGPGQHWAVVWSEDSAAVCLGGDIAFAVVASDGTIAQSRLGLDLTNLNVDSAPDVSGDGTHFLAVWHRGSSAPRDIMGALIGPSASGFAKLTASLNLTQLEPGAPLSADQTSPCVEWDGCRFAYGYSEGSPPRPFLATLAFDVISPIFYEGHLAASTAASTLAHSSIVIAAEGGSGGDPGICQAAWQLQGSGGRDLRGVEFDLRAPTGGVTRVLTHCPTSVASSTSIDTVGTPALGRTFAVQLGNVQSLPFVIAGARLPVPLTLCATAHGTCRQGVQLPALVTQFGTSLAVGVPCDIGMVGLDITFQGLDIGATGGCSSSLFGVAFRVTDTLVVRIM